MSNGIARCALKCICFDSLLFCRLSHIMRMPIQMAMSGDAFPPDQKPLIMSVAPTHTASDVERSIRRYTEISVKIVSQDLFSTEDLVIEACESQGTVYIGVIIDFAAISTSARPP